MRANVFDRSVFTAGTYRKAGERIDVCPFGSCCLLIERSFMSVIPLTTVRRLAGIPRRVVSETSAFGPGSMKNGQPTFDPD
jgi:hypothetical protein